MQLQISVISVFIAYEAHRPIIITSARPFWDSKRRCAARVPGVQTARIDLPATGAKSIHHPVRPINSEMHPVCGFSTYKTAGVRAPDRIVFESIVMMGEVMSYRDRQL